jgi:hypothetical protein
LQRRGLVESHLSIAPREGRDFFAKRNENQLLCPVEIRIDETLQVARERWKEERCCGGTVVVELVKPDPFFFFFCSTRCSSQTQAPRRALDAGERLLTVSGSTSSTVPRLSALKENVVRALEAPLRAADMRVCEREPRMSDSFDAVQQRTQTESQEVEGDITTGVDSRADIIFKGAEQDQSWWM